MIYAQISAAGDSALRRAVRSQAAVHFPWRSTWQ